MRREIQSLIDQHATSGNRLELRCDDLSGCDFSKHNFKGAIVAHCDLTDCIMPSNCKGVNFGWVHGRNVDFSTNKSDLTGADFQMCFSFDGWKFVGATWAGEVITAQPWILFNKQVDKYWSMGTDKHFQVGCKIYSMDQAMGFSDDDLRKLDPKSEQEPVIWWARNKSNVIKLASQYAANSHS